MWTVVARAETSTRRLGPENAPSNTGLGTSLGPSPQNAKGFSTHAEMARSRAKEYRISCLSISRLSAASGRLEVHQLVTHNSVARSKIMNRSLLAFHCNGINSIRSIDLRAFHLCISSRFAEHESLLQFRISSNFYRASVLYKLQCLRHLGQLDQNSNAALHYLKSDAWINQHKLGVSIGDFNECYYRD